MTSGRSYADAVTNSVGEVWVTGGWDGTSRHSSSELLAPGEYYLECLDSVDSHISSPGNDTWRPAGQLSFARYQHCGVVTGDGSVVITGGQEGRGKYGAAVDTVER